MRTYGTAKLEDGHWLMKVEAQVAMRAKRTFPKISAKATELKLIDTLENCRELLWFIDRFPLILSRKDWDYLHKRTKEHQAHVARIDALCKGEDRRLKFDLAIPARDYQKIASELMYHTRGMILGDELGTGKTCSAIGLIAQAECRPALVCTLTHLPGQWRDEIKRFLPCATVHIAKTTKPVQFDTMPDVMVMNYAKLPGWSGELAGKVRSVIFDEVQELRSGIGTNRYHGAEVVCEKAIFKIGLTGTPVYNNGTEVWNILNVLKPGCLGSSEEFHQEWCGSGDFVRDPAAFGAYLKEAGLFLRRTKKDIGRELPPLTVVPQHIDCDLRELDKIKSSAAELAKIILAQGGTGLEKMQAAEELSWKLREATGIAKAPFVADFIRMLVENGESVLVGLWHHAVCDILKERLADLNPVCFTGRESATQKAESHRKFMDGSARINLMSNRAGAGLDGLQKVCCTVVHAELDWTPAVHEQLTGRIFRDGQPYPVTSFYLLSDSGSDPVISDTLGVKAQQLEGIRNPENKDNLKQVDPDRIKKLAADYLKRHGLADPQREEGVPF